MQSYHQQHLTFPVTIDDTPVPVEEAEEQQPEAANPAATERERTSDDPLPLPVTWNAIANAHPSERWRLLDKMSREQMLQKQLVMATDGEGDPFQSSDRVAEIADAERERLAEYRAKHRAACEEQARLKQEFEASYTYLPPGGSPSVDQQRLLWIMNGNGYYLEEARNRCDDEAEVESACREIDFEIWQEQRQALEKADAVAEPATTPDFWQAWCEAIQNGPDGSRYPTSEADPTGRGQHEPGAKLDAGKNRCGLVIHGFAGALEEVSRVGTFGANKYTPNGWRTVPNGQERYTDALYRHLLKEAQGEKLDPDSGLAHAAHAAWNALARLQLQLDAATTNAPKEGKTNA